MSCIVFFEFYILGFEGSVIKMHFFNTFLYFKINKMNMSITTWLKAQMLHLGARRKIRQVCFQPKMFVCFFSAMYFPEANDFKKKCKAMQNKIIEEASYNFRQIKNFKPLMTNRKNRIVCLTFLNPVFCRCRA